MDNYITLSNGVRMPRIGCGTWSLSGTVLNQIVKTAIDCGYQLFDSAFFYKNEKSLAKALNNTNVNRNDIFLVSKAHPQQFIGRKRYLFLNKKNVAQCYNDAINKLNTTHLDMFMLHDGTFDYINRFKELLQLYDSGKTRSIGVCNVDIAILKDLKKTTGRLPHLIQCQMHPLYTKKRLLDYCRDNDIVFEAHSQFALNSPKLFSNPILHQIANEHGKSIQQIILRWLLQLDCIAIPRSSNPQNIVSNISIFDFKLTDEEMLLIDNLNENYSIKEYDIPSDFV